MKCYNVNNINVNGVNAKCILMPVGCTLVKHISSQTIHTMDRLIEIKVPNIIKTCFYRVILGRAKDPNDEIMGFVFTIKDQCNDALDFDLLYNAATARRLLLLYSTTVVDHLSGEFEDFPGMEWAQFNCRLDDIRSLVHDNFGFTFPKPETR
jgi:hypothetical protein